MMRRLLCTGATFLAFLVLPVGVFAQTPRSYSYSDFASTYTVHTDSTVSVEEKETYQFIGIYHKGYRSLSHKGSDAITDIRVYDENGTLLTRASGDLNKDDPSSWGSYTVSDTGSETDISWYYNLTDTTHSWTIVYTLHGAISFLTSHDELYWNLFSSLDAPVASAEATIILPGDDTAPTFTSYVNGAHDANITQTDPHTFHFTGTSFAAGEPATFAVGWQKGLVDQRAYWRDWFISHWPYLVSGIALLLTAIFCSLWWFFTERYKQGTGVIVAQYEPPRGLTPAIAGLVANERLTKRTWPATIVDLAVRGLVKIEEDSTSPFYSALSVLAKVSLWAVFIVLVMVFIRLGVGQSLSENVAPLFIFGLVLFYLQGPLREGIAPPKDYIVTLLCNREDARMLSFERAFVSACFEGSVLSTKKLRKATSSYKRDVYMALKKVEKSTLEEADADTQAYAHTLAQEQKGKTLLLLTCILLAAVLVLVTSLSQYAYEVLGAALALCIIAVLYFVKYEARLNKDGQILKEEILGFKLYLATAERYRMQNLTPDMFEKYLSYAILFGVEKKWAKAFAGLTLPAPTWYIGRYGVVGNATAGPSSFSPSAFSGAFSASFASAFANSGASGASGGGGGAGGGGGGGGGGAS